MTTEWKRWICLAWFRAVGFSTTVQAVWLLLAALAATPSHAAVIVADPPGPMPKPTLMVRVQPDSAEIGQPLNFYVGAVFQGQVFIKTADSGWRLWTPGSPIPSFQSAIGSTSHSISVFDGSLDLSSVSGAKVYVGYGHSEAEMLGAAGHLQRVYTVYTPGTVIGRYRLATRGVWTAFDRRGYPNGYHSGDMIQRFNQFDSELQRNLDVNSPGTRASPTVGAEVGLQLDVMRAWGINTVVVALGTSDPTYVPDEFVPPVCNIPPVGGFQWPQPTPTELANLAAFFDLAQSKGIRVQLMLNNTHMEENPPTNAQAWLGAILNVVKNHPALDVVAFGGNTHTVDTNGDGIPDICGTPAEPPLWLGPTSVPAQYVKWAIQYGISLGVPARKLSAEAIVGDFFTDSQAHAGPEATDRHLWSPIVILKGIFDSLGIPANQRTYVVSFYQHRKCSMARNLPCTDVDPHTWAEQTIQTVRSVVGNNGSRIVAAEMGAMNPIQASWPAERALESLGYLMEKYGIDGGNYWIWSESDSAYEAHPDRPGEPIKRRGLNFVYNPVQKELVDLAGFHLAVIANGSFETGGASADNWTGGGAGTVGRFRLADEPGQPVVPSRGNFALRLTTGSGANDAVSATSDEIDVSPNTAYTTTANLRFQWSGDPNVGIASASRPQVYVMVRYFGGDGRPSAIRSQDIFRFYQENGSIDFGTFPLSYSTPADAMTVKLEFGVLRNGLPRPITLDVDNVR